MATIDEKVGKKPSVHISQDDFENAEEVGYETDSPSTALTNALEDSVILKDIQEAKKEEVKKEIERLRKICRKYSIDFSELL